MAYRSRRDVLRYGLATVSFSVPPLSRLACRGVPPLATPATSRLLMGVNLAGAEFETIGGRWRWPSSPNLAYYLEKGFNVYRIPFRWERLQPEMNRPLLEEALEGLDALIVAINASGATAILDAHNYGRRENSIIGSGNSPASVAKFSDFWGRMAARYKDRPQVWFNLMNEPHDMPAHANLEAQNAASKAIRVAGAQGKILFSGIAWTGAHSWIQSGNSQMMLQATDPENNYAFDVHQYLDPGFGGSGPQPVQGIGGRILDGVTNWARENGKRLFLGEFGGGQTPAFLAEIDALLMYISNNRDVYIGATYFAGGGGWGRNTGSSDPIDGVDKPQTLLLEKYLESY